MIHFKCKWLTRRYKSKYIFCGNQNYATSGVN